MARQTTEELSGLQLSLVYIAGNLVDAKAAERVLTESGIEYALNLEPFTTTSVMGGEYMGLFVYVRIDDHEPSRVLLQTHGLADTVALDEPALAEGCLGA